MTALSTPTAPMPRVRPLPPHLAVELSALRAELDRATVLMAPIIEAADRIAVRIVNLRVALAEVADRA